jgi:NosR/NirI family nitrous oxide reductase transcriptional regulator
VITVEAAARAFQIAASPNSRRHAAARWAWSALLLISAIAIFSPGQPVQAASRLQDYLPQAAAADFFPDGTRIGPPQGDPPIAPVYDAGGRLLGHLYLNSDFTNSTGYSGKPIDVLVGIDPAGVVRGLKLVAHKEPIVLIGIPEGRVVAAVKSLIGLDAAAISAGASPPQVDIVSGATVTILVLGDSVVRSAVRLIRSGRLSQAGAQTGAAAAPARSLDMERSEIEDWETLLGDGSVRRLHLTISDVNEAFERSGNEAAAANPEPGEPDETFIDLYTALVSAPTIGRSLLGDEGYERLRERLAPGQQAIVVAGEGLYSFKGSGYVRGGIFDRIELIQDGAPLRFRDRNHTRIGDLLAEGAPQFPEIALFAIPKDFAFDPVEPWELRLLVQRATGARDKAFLGFDLGYRLPEKHLKPAANPVQAESAAPAPPLSSVAPKEAGSGALDQQLWQRIWLSNLGFIAIAACALLVLTAIFFFQDWLVRRPRTYVWVRRAFLAFTLIWLGWYANAQLSVVNILTFTNSLITNFSWEYFLAAPLIFILWAAVAAALLFWGRGPFCGWLCPFGALQELTNTLAQWLKVPQIKVPWGLHERLWPVKYIIFLGLFGLSLYSVALAETFAEVEPFKTAIVLKFARDWPFVVYALTLLSIGLFIERFFCRYLCPLGAALAIPGRIRMFEWLKRWPECGSPCQRCAKECPVQSIHPEGHINVNECIYCMHCQELYYDDHRCPHMIQVRLKRERRVATTSPSMRGGKEPAPQPPNAAPAPTAGDTTSSN